MAEALVTVTGAAFGYHGKPVIEQIDLTLRPGDFTGIVGPNGAGKTTLFRGLLGLIPPLVGSVKRNANALGYVPQREALDPVYPITVEEVVHMGAYGRLHGWRALSTDDRALAQDCLERVGLAHRGREQFSSLSGGQRQRALIARALMARPALMLLDEPTSGVDRDAAEQILELLDELTRTRGMAILLVSHQIELLARAVHDVLWVDHGLVTRGSAEDLFAPERLTQLIGGHRERRAQDEVPS